MSQPINHGVQTRLQDFAAGTEAFEYRFDCLQFGAQRFRLRPRTLQRLNTPAAALQVPSLRCCNQHVPRRGGAVIASASETTWSMA
jgi:hypothetical protein